MTRSSPSPSACWWPVRRSCSINCPRSGGKDFGHSGSRLGDDSVRTILTRLGPGVIGVAAFQINVLITYCIGFLPANMSWRRTGTPCACWNCRRDCSPSQWQRFYCRPSRGWRLRKSTTISVGNWTRPRGICCSSICRPPPCCSCWLNRLCSCSSSTANLPAATERGVGAALSGAGLPGYSLVLILGPGVLCLGRSENAGAHQRVCLGLNLVLALAMVFQLEDNWRQCALAWRTPSVPP